MIYLDNAATTYPKPREVTEAITKAMLLYGANPGRSGHNMSVNSAMCVYSAREELNKFFNGYGSEYVSFAQNCTLALNEAIKGTVEKGDHVVISSLEHNSVARPVNTLFENGIITYSVFNVDKDDSVTVENFIKALKPNTKLAVVTSVSNVFGNILPLEKLSKEAHRNETLFFVDGAQGAGIIDIDMKKQGINCLCVPGHKGLLGPMGTGALLHDGCIKKSIIEGGTGTSSFSLSQPLTYPEILESGTLNVPGIAGLNAGVKIVERYGIKNIFEEESELIKTLYEGLKNIDGIKLYTEYTPEKYAPLMSFNIKELHSEEVSALLNEDGIAVRGGYHCAPLAHKTYGTEKYGSVRVCPSKFTSKKDINILLNLIYKIAIS